MKNSLLQMAALFAAGVLLIASPQTGSAQTDKGAAASGPGYTTTARIHGTEQARASVNFSELAKAEALHPAPKVEGTAHRRPLRLPLRTSAAATVTPTEPITSTPTPLAAATPNAAQSFIALPDDGTVIPPDTDGAVGPNHVVTILNSQVGIQDRFGNSISVVSFTGFWAPVNAVKTTDPRVLYDPYQNRWITTASDLNPPARILIGVSATDDPTGVWNLFAVTADSSGQSFADFPETGFNKDWIVIQANMFTLSGNTYSGSNIFVFDKAALYAGTSAPFTLLTGPDGGEAPATMYDSSLATIYLLDDAGPGLANLYSITGAVGSETLSAAASVTAPRSWQAAPADSGVLPQLSGPNNIDAGDTRMISVKYRNGFLWATQTVFLPATGAVTRVAGQWWQIDPLTQAVVQFGRVDDPTTNFSYAYPSIAVNKNNDVLIGYSRFSSTQYASACYSYRASTDALSTLRPEVLLKAGEGVYFKTFSGAANRWGDYSATVIDPLNDRDFWTIQEYAATPSPPGTANGDGNWGTWWGFVKSPRAGLIDFNGDGRSDLVWRQASTGVTVLWMMNGSATLSTANLGGSPDWSLVAAGDFNGDGFTDVIWHQASTGATVMWLMNGVTKISSALIGLSTDWSVVATGDFNGDGKTDLVWRQASTGATVLWLMNGPSIISATNLGESLDWSVTATGDFNGDGKTDLVWRQASTGATVLWLMNGSSIISATSLGGSPDWSVKATGDFNGDGKTDLIWGQASTGATVLWLMNGSSIISATYLGGSPDWSVVETGDFNGDGMADLIWRQASTGATAVWLMNGSAVISSGYLGGSSDWSVTAVK